MMQWSSLFYPIEEELVFNNRGEVEHFKKYIYYLISIHTIFGIFNIVNENKLTIGVIEITCMAIFGLATVLNTIPILYLIYSVISCLSCLVHLRYIHLSYFEFSDIYNIINICAVITSCCCALLSIEIYFLFADYIYNLSSLGLYYFDYDDELVQHINQSSEDLVDEEFKPQSDTENLYLGSNNKRECIKSYIPFEGKYSML
ncbi:uncharacterized protein CMU_036560 [Cryptosporidium muris RN66]|uniref:Uncharacterized protein n=1 Tax=Cryptosporidium muris (strain RN66) TaxID=441375 RepID=B6AGZ1_CRYMR|nr:uncharacterized protein CMU_036560 [Cryptosporidium muris RN66]EEA07482.1 hypothetical protein, conserved [Cryptosporidium muris RN66]|eukprot:XP_002141831.1 hypothetical protein [Cryptosporidium muris RN66]